MNQKYFWLWFLFLPVGPAYCGTLQPVALESRWPDVPVIIDGKDDDWQKRSIAVGEQRMVVDIANDEANLYLYVHTWDRALVRSMLLRGFAVWFESPGSGKLGIRFPLGLANEPGYEAAAADPQKMKEFLERNGDMMNRMEVIEADSGKKVNSTLQYFQQAGISAALQVPETGLVYELKIPLVQRPDRPYAAVSGETKTFRLYFDFPFFEKSAGPKMSKHQGMNNTQTSSGMPTDALPPPGMRGDRMHGGGLRDEDFGGSATGTPEQPELYQRPADPILEADVSIALPQDKTASEDQNPTIKGPNEK